MEKPFRAREEADESPEGGDLGDGALVDLPHLGLAGELLYAGLGLLRLLHVAGVDADGAVLLYVHLHAQLLQGPDVLAPRADDDPDFLHRHLEAEDAGGEGLEGGAGGGEDHLHEVQDLQPGLPGLEEGLLEDLPGEAAHLVVHLQGGDPLAGSRHLEVHVPQGVFQPQDVGEDHGLLVLPHQAHGHPGHRGLDGHPGVHEGQAPGADRGHGATAVGLQDVPHHPDGVGEGFLGGEDRPQGPLGQVAVAHLPAGHPSEALDLPGGEGGEVVVDQEGVGLVNAQVVNDLLVAARAQGHRAQDLGLPPGEDGGAVGPG